MKNDYQKSRNIRIFISSTFQDMQSERDILVTKVFPRLRQIAYERNVTLTEVDLRWGITQEEAESSKVIEICLDEIRNSHPFFIGLLGERYGWCPSKEELIKQNAVPAGYEWLGADLDRGMSITEIEIQYGVLRSPEPVCASFYIRKPDGGTRDTDPRQTRLKKEVRDNEQYNVYDYNSAEQLAEQLEHEFMLLIDRLYPIDETKDLVTRERLMLQAFVDNKSENYIPDTAYISRLDMFLDDVDSRHLVITGESGMGKSSLLAYWLGKVMKNDQWNVVAHFPTNSSRKSDTTEITDYLTTQIDLLYELEQTKENDQKIERDTPADKIAYEKLAFRAKLIAGQKPLLIVLDGINQLLDRENKVKLFNWLPDFSNNVRIIFSSTEQDAAMQVFKRHKYPIMIVYPLLLDQRKRLIVDYFARYRKRLSEQQLTMILKGSNITDNTMVLMSLLEEIRCFGSFDNLTDFIGQMTVLPDTESFFDRLLQHKEKIYDTPQHPSLTADLLSLIALSGDGLSETELIAISNLSPLYWSQFYCANTAHLMIRNGCVVFVHAMIRHAVEQRYLSGEREKQLRQNIIDYFKGEEENSSRRMTELPYQLYRAEKWDELYECISLLGYMSQQFKANDIHRFVLYWRSLKQVNTSKYRIARGYIEQITTSTSDIAEMVAMMQMFRWQVFRIDLIRLANLCISYLDELDAASELTRFMIRMCEQLDKDDTYEERSAYYNLAGTINLRKKKHIQALREYRNGLSLITKAFGENDLKVTPFLSNIAEVYCCMSELQEPVDKEALKKAKMIWEKALEMRQASLPALHDDIAILYDNLAGVYRSLGEEESAEKYRLESQQIYIAIRGENDLDVAIAYHNYAVDCHSAQNFDQAKEYARKALGIYLNIMGYENSSTQKEYYTLAIIEAQSGDYATAAENMEHAVEICRRIGNRDMSLVNLQNKLSALYFRAKQYDHALSTEMKNLDLLETLKQTDSDIAASIYDNLGKFHLALNNKKLSEYYYLKAAETWQRLDRPEKEADSYSYLASAYNTFNRLEDAMTMQEKTLALLHECGRERSETAAYANNNYATMCYRAGNILKALEHEEMAYDIRYELFGPDDPIVIQYEDTIDQLRQKMENSVNIVNLTDNAPNEKKVKEANAEIEEFVGYADTDNLELIGAFRDGRDAFQAGNLERAIDKFNYALYLCDKEELDDMSMARCLIYRYLAFSIELKKEDDQKALEYYRKAANITERNNNDVIGERVFKDIAEFNWNRNEFELAEISYWNEMNCLFRLYGCYNKKTITCLNNAAQAMIKQDTQDWIIILRCFEFIYALTNNNEEFEQLNEAAGNGIDVSIRRLEQTDKTFDSENYIIDIECSVIDLMDYLIKQRIYDTAHELYRLFLNQVCEKTGTTVDTYCMLNIQIMTIHALTGDPHQVIVIGYSLLQKIEPHHPSDSIMSRIETIIADACRDTMQYEDAISLYEARLSSDPDVTLSLAKCYNALSNPQKALQLLEYATEQSPSITEQLIFDKVLGKILLDMGRIQDALEAFKRCETDDVDTDAILVTIHKALALYLLGNETEAMPLIRTAMELLENENHNILKRIVTGVELADYMFRIDNGEQANKIIEELYKLLDRLSEDERKSYTACITALFVANKNKQS